MIDPLTRPVEGAADCYGPFFSGEVIDTVTAAGLKLWPTKGGTYLVPYGMHYNEMVRRFGPRRSANHRLEYGVSTPATTGAQANAKFGPGAAKASYAEIPPAAITALGAVMEGGADKYGAFNWRGTGVDRRTYFNATMRHLMALWAGEDLDPESGQPHEAHIMACCAILLDAKDAGVLEDNRPPAAGGVS